MEVLGTRFNVSAYDESPVVDATLVEGRLKVSVTDPAASKTPSVILTPKRKATYYKNTHRVEVVETDTWFETAWTRGDLVFRAVSLPDLMHRLELCYGVTICLEGNVSNTNLFSGSFNEDSVYGILRKLKPHYNMDIETKNDVIYVKLY